MPINASQKAQLAAAITQVRTLIAALEPDAAAPAPSPAPAPAPSPAPSPAPTPSPSPSPAPTPSGDVIHAAMLNFAETASRNWNHGGHSVDAQFTANQGLWDYTETTSEPWLFDRPTAWRKFYELTGDARWLAQAESDLAWYQARIGADGVFTPKGFGDTKYSYVHPWSTRADNAAIAKRVYDATLRDWPNIANLSGLWTERELWVALNAANGYHTVSGEAAALSRGQAMLDQWDAVCAGRGAPLVTYTLHEGGGPGGTQPQDLISSPWMSALYFQAARAYVSKVPGAAAQVNRQASDYFDWLNVPANRGFYPGTEAHAQYAGFWFPAYIAGGTTIGEAGPDSGNMDHALDIAGFIAFAIKAKQALGLPTEAAQQRLADMKATTVRNFENWTRTTTYLPRYRMMPPRKWNWWVQGYYELRSNE